MEHDDDCKQKPENPQSITEAPTEAPEKSLSYDIGGDAVEDGDAEFPLKVISRYEPSGKLGEGGMAIVHQARDKELDREIAIKLLRPELTEVSTARGRFLDEAKIMASLDHPGAIPIYEVGARPDGQCFYAMKKVRGETLRELLRSRNAAGVVSRHTMLHFVDLYEKICLTMAAAHEEAIIHRDLKPENVMVDKLGSVYVMDWGLAKRLPEVGFGSDSERTRHGAVMGSPAYMSPEQASGQAADSDRQSDVFSLGVMLYEILTGVNPFAARDGHQSMKGIMHHEPDPPHKLNPRAGRALSAVCMKALNKDPFKRYADAGELASEIRRFREFRPVAAKKTSVSEKLANWARRRPTLAAVSATLILVATVIGLAAASQASVESRLVSGAYERIDQREQEIAEIESEMREIRSRTDFLEKGGDPDAAEQLLELKARRELRTDEIRSLASAIMGFTIFSPDGRAQRILHDDLFDEIRFYLEAEDDHRSRIAIEHALEWYGDRNLIGITDDEADWLRQQGEVVKERQSGG